jgi:hypothetical protein
MSMLFVAVAAVLSLGCSAFRVSIGNPGDIRDEFMVVLFGAFQDHSQGLE